MTKGDVSFWWYGAVASASIVQLIGWNFCSEDQKKIEKGCGEVVSGKKTVVGARGFSWNDLPPPVSRMMGEAGGFEVKLELMLLYPSLNVSCPLSLHTTQTEIDGEWARNQATLSLGFWSKARVGTGRVCRAFWKGLKKQRDLQQ